MGFEQDILEAANKVRTRAVTRKIRDAIVASFPDQIRLADRPNRVYAPNLSPEEFISVLKSICDTDVQIIEPKQEGSGSSKFSTFRFNVGDVEVSLVLAKGIPAGRKIEERQELTIHTQIQQEGSITLEYTDVEGKVHHFEGIDGFVKLDKNKKADFAFTRQGENILYLQHKSLDHQQMSGTSRFDRQKYTELDEFIKEVELEVLNSPGNRLLKSVSKPFESLEMKVLAVYGDQDGTVNGVQIYAIGDLRLEGEGNIKILVADKLYNYPEVPDGEDMPVLGATYRLDRNQYGVPFTRFGIYPASYFKGS